MVAEQRLHIWKTPAFNKTTYPHKPRTYPALLQHPVQATTNLMHGAEAVFELAVAHGMPRADHSHTGRALCAVVNPGFPVQPKNKVF